MKYKVIDLEQGTPEWIEYRRSKVTATDAPVIMEMTPYTTPYQLWERKIYNKSVEMNARMERGQQLEPIAREKFIQETGINVKPATIESVEIPFMMASLDGIGDSDAIVEIKCPGERDHQTAKEDRVPGHYYPQIQHQMAVVGASRAFYYSFDGKNGILLEVKRNDDFIREMIKKEKVFYECLINLEAPKLVNKDYIEGDTFWNEAADIWKRANEKLKDAQENEENARRRLLSLSLGNTKGNGICVSKYSRKGNVDYKSIPELKDVNLDLYRKAPADYWRVIHVE